MNFSETPVSICIATYNGSDFLHLQIESILSQLRHFDELVIVDDASLDNTVEIIKSFHDNRINLFRHDINIGHSKTFEAAIKLSSHSVILLSDQDDIWPPKRLYVLFHQLLDSQSSILFSSFIDFRLSASNHVSSSILPDFCTSNLLKSYICFYHAFSGRYKLYGCTAIFHRSLLDLVLPIPNTVHQHDYWFALISLLTCQCSLSSYPSLLHRIHENNVTTKFRRSLVVVFASRIILFSSLSRRLFSHLFSSLFCKTSL